MIHYPAPGYRGYRPNNWTKIAFCRGFEEYYNKRLVIEAAGYRGLLDNREPAIEVPLYHCILYILNIFSWNLVTIVQHVTA